MPVPASGSGTMPFTSRAADAGDGFGRVDDRDAGMAAEGEEVGIAGDDQVGSRCGREGEHRVVRGIAADWCRQRRRIDDLGKPPQFAKRPLGIGFGAGQDHWNFGRFMTSASSAGNAGLMIRVSASARTCFISACGLPRQNKPDSSTLVSNDRPHFAGARHERLLPPDRSLPWTSARYRLLQRARRSPEAHQPLAGA
jgi:hypothetical protein